MRRDHRDDFDYDQTRILADLLVAPRAVTTEAQRADRRQVMLAAARREFNGTEGVGGSRDGLEVETYSVQVEHPVFPAGLRLTDLEPITPQRAAEVADRVAEAIVEHVWEEL